MTDIGSEGLLALQRTVHTVIKALDDDLSDLGLTASETNLLACVGPTGPARLRDLIEATAQRPSTVTSVVDRLEGRGLVEREIDTRDRRSFQVVLTPEGRAVQAQVETAYRELARRVADELRGGGTPTFLESLEALRKAAGPGD